MRARLRYEPGGGQPSILVVLVTGPDGRAVMGAIQDSTYAWNWIKAHWESGNGG